MLHSILLMLFASGAHADTRANVAYDCEVIVIAKDLPQGSATFKYQAPKDGGAHGGSGYDFTAGPYKIGVLSDGRWLAITWLKGSTQISAATFARSDVNQGSEALILGNPLDMGEQVSVDCAKKLAD